MIGAGPVGLRMAVECALLGESIIDAVKLKEIIWNPPKNLRKNLISPTTIHIFIFSFH